MMVPKVELLAVLALLAFFCYFSYMATIVIRNLDETVKRRLQVRAALNGRSMEAEARAALAEVLDESPAVETTRAKPRRKEVGLATAIRRRFKGLGGDDIPIPPRTFSRHPEDGSELLRMDKGLGTAIHELFAPLGGADDIPIPPRTFSNRPLPTFGE